MARPMANDPPFATLNHDTADLGIPKSQTPRELVLLKQAPKRVWVIVPRMPTLQSGGYDLFPPFA